MENLQDILMLFLMYAGISIIVGLLIIFCFAIILQKKKKKYYKDLKAGKKIKGNYSPFISFSIAFSNNSLMYSEVVIFLSIQTIFNFLYSAGVIIKAIYFVLPDLSFFKLYCFFCFFIMHPIFFYLTYSLLQAP